MIVPVNHTNPKKRRIKFNTTFNTYIAVFSSLEKIKNFLILSIYLGCLLLGFNVRQYKIKYGTIIKFPKSIYHNIIS